MKEYGKISIFLISIGFIIRISFLFIDKTKTFGNDQKTPQIEKVKQQKTIDKTTNIEKKYAQELEKEINTQKEVKITEILEENKNTEKQTQTKITNEVKIETNNQENIILPKSYDIQNVAFYSQAPYGNRNQPYQDACEEASLLIGQYYLNGTPKSVAEYHKDLLAMVDLEMEMLGYYKSTTIMEMKQIINRRDPSIKAKIIEYPTIKDLEKEISQNNMVIAPFYGKGLQNPHYALGGPEYHFLVIKGYDENNFITHDVGTSKGANWIYPKSLIMEHIHDRNRINVQKGAARVLVMYK